MSSRLDSRIPDQSEEVSSTRKSSVSALQHGKQGIELAMALTAAARSQISKGILPVLT